MQNSQQNISKTLYTNTHIDHILTQQIGFGQAQYKLCRPINLLLFSQGCQSIVLGILIPIIKIQWGLQSSNFSILITLVYLGVALGSYLQTFSDIYGRKDFVKYSIIIQSIFGLLSCVTWNFQSFLFARFFYGIAMGISFPLSGSYVGEVTPTAQRAKLLIYARYYFSFGMISTCLIGWYLLQYNAWRLLLFIICLPGIYAYWQHYKNGRETLKFLWVNKRQQQVIQLINFMCKQNKRQIINKQKIIGILSLQQDQKNKIQNTSFYQLINNKYYSSTWRLIICWFVATFIYYGIQLLLPSILQSIFSSSNNYNFKYFFILAVNIAQLFVYVVCQILIDNPKVGRKKSVSYGATLSFIMTIFIILAGTSHQYLLLISFFILRFSITNMLLSLYPYTAEIYDTLLRGKGLGMCSLSGRFGVITLGMIGVYALNWLNGNGLYAIFLLLSGIGLLSAFTMPYCTLNKIVN